MFLYQLCFRLSAAVTKFNFESESPSKLMDIENVTSSLESVFRNNGNARISQDYTVAQRYKETVEFTKATGWSNVRNVKVEASLEIKNTFDIPFLTSTEVKTTIGGSYEWQDTTSGSDTKKKSKENEQTTTIRQAIEIPPCTEYSVDYTATARLTGKAGDDIMHANELKKNVGPGMEFVRELDEFAIEVQVKGQMYANYGIKTFIVGEGHPIEGCLQNIPKSNKPNFPKHFEIELPLKKD